jgi:transposase-like protein
MAVQIGGTRLWLWRAVDSEGEVLDMLVQRQRDKAAVVKLMRKRLKKQAYAPAVLVTSADAASVSPNWHDRSSVQERRARTIPRWRVRPPESGVDRERLALSDDGQENAVARAQWQSDFQALPRL